MQNAESREQRCTSRISQNTEKQSVVLPSPLPQKVVEKPRIMGSKLVEAVQALLGLDEKLHPPCFSFETMSEAAQKNFKLLQQENFQLGKLLNKGRKSVVTYNSEFKSWRDLQQLLRKHPRWNAMKARLMKGAKFPLDNITEVARVGDLVGRLERGNHKSAKKNENFLAEALAKEVAKGWLLPLPAERALDIPGLEMAPLGVVTHIGISANRDYVEKDRVTHDLPFPGAYSNTSVNDRVQEELLELRMFGHMLSRLFHYIIRL